MAGRVYSALKAVQRKAGGAKQRPNARTAPDDVVTLSGCCGLVMTNSPEGRFPQPWHPKHSWRSSILEIGIDSVIDITQA